MDENERLTRSSLGTMAFIGELYNARKDSFSSRSLFESSFPSKSFIEKRDINRMEFDYKFTQNISDRFELINVEAQLRLNIILGLIKLEGSGKFLTDETESEKAVSCTLAFKMLSVNEKLFSSFSEILPYIDMSALMDPEYTHVNVEANWGANCLLSLEQACSCSSEKNKIQGSLSAELSIIKQLISVEGGGKLKKKNLDLSNKSDIKLTIRADVVPENEWPTSVEDFFRFVSEVPRLIGKVNNGKGKPLNYIMIPLLNIRKLAKLNFEVFGVVQRIHESFILSTIYFFEEISQIKRKFHDVVSEMSENYKYVKDEVLREVKSEQRNLCIKESTLKSRISSDLEFVRSGKMSMEDLIRKTEKFKYQVFNLLTYEDFLNSCSVTLEKLSQVRHYISKGIIYLGKGEKFSTLQLMRPSCEFVVLVTSSEIEKAAQELYRKTCCYFITLATEQKSNIMYVVVDLDYTEEKDFLGIKTKEPKCYYLNGTRIISSDLYADYLNDLKSNLVRLKNGLLMTYIQHKPSNRTPVEIVCPGAEVGTCSSNTLKWICFQCRSSLEYGFDLYFYCSCGRNLATLFEFRCSNPKHGSFFISASSDFLENALSTLKPLKEMNLLILGQSGVGKSTWINSIVNYLTYESLDTAKECGVITTIPTSFAMYDSVTLEKHVIKIGNPDENQKESIGESETRRCHTYSFLWQNRYVRIIDTPGLGDTKGINQDKENLSVIVDHISHLKELHGVCILLKANDSRITVMFSFCLKELLVHLHKSVTKNILFCFTNARSSFYTPGQTSALLEKVLDSLEIKKELTLGTYNMFCLDNEAFLFLCSLTHSNIRYDEFLKKSFAQSWEISLKETKRLFDTVKTFKPHLLEETLSLITARQRILSLTKPVAEISKTIQMNVAAIEERQEEIKASTLAIELLAANLVRTEIQLEPEPLPRPRTVCTTPSCVNYLTYKGVNVKEIEYKTHCHSECYLDEVTPKTINNVLLKNCEAMINGVCKNCGCGWENHMHVTVAQKRVEKQVMDKEKQEDLLKKKSAKEAIETFVEKLNSIVDQYRKEQSIIIEASVKFGMFLRQNAITFYNDSVEEYLQYLIKEEENKPYRTNTEDKILENLKETLSRYKAEVHIFQQVINKGKGITEKLTVKDVDDLEKQLYGLELTGESIKKSAEIGRASESKAFYYSETTVQINKPKKDNINLISKLWNKLSVPFFKEQADLQKKT